MQLMEFRATKDPPDTPARQSILGTPRRGPATQTQLPGGVERMVGVTSVNLGGIEVDVEDVADRLRRLKVPFLPCAVLTIRNGRCRPPR
jgi:hypothetical protein